MPSKSSADAQPAIRITESLRNHWGQRRIARLCLWGEGDTCVIIDWADLVPKHYVNLKFIPVKGTGHFTMREQPDIFNREVISFLKG